MWLGGVTDGNADDVFHLIEASAIEIDAVTYFASDSSSGADRAHKTYCHSVDGGYDGDADAGARSIVPPRYPRYYIDHRVACGEIHISDGLHLYLASNFCLHGLALDYASPHLHP